MVAAKLVTMRSGARTDLEPPANLPEVSQPAAAQLLNVSERSVRHARQVIDKGTTTLRQAVEQGDIPVSRAAAIVRATAASAEESGEKTKAAPRPTRKPRAERAAEITSLAAGGRRL